MDEFGLEGYGAYWLLLEAIAEKCDDSDDVTISMSPQNWRKVLPFYPKRLAKFAQCLGNLQLFSVEVSNSLITISCPKLLKYRDEYSERKSKKSGVCREFVTPRLDIDTESEKDKKKGRKTSCGQPAETAVLPPQVIPADVVVSFPLNSGEAFPVTAAKVEELTPLYPAVDVSAELRKMAGWLIGNPTHRKTKSGVMRFVTAWLAKAQDRGGTSPPPGQLKAATVYQQKQIEGGQKARILQEIRRKENGRDADEALAGDSTQVALEGRPSVSAKVGPCGIGRADGPLD